MYPTLLLELRVDESRIRFYAQTEELRVTELKAKVAGLRLAAAQAAPSGNVGPDQDHDLSGCRHSARAHDVRGSARHVEFRRPTVPVDLDPDRKVGGIV